MTNAERVKEFLRQNKGKYWCDECIADACGFPSTWTAQMIVKVLIKLPDYEVISNGCVNPHKHRRRATSYNGQT